MDLEADTNDPSEDLYIANDPDFTYTDFQPSHHDTIFIIDNSQSMLDPMETGEIPFYMALEAVVGYMKDKIISDAKDAVGVVLMNAGETDNHLNFAGLRVIQPLQPADVTGIRTLQDYRNTPFPPSTHPSLLVESLWLAHDLFTRKSGNTGNERSLCILTDEDNPNKNALADQRRAIQRAKDLEELGISIDVFPFNTHGNRFNPSVFYKELVEIEDENEYLGFEKIMQLKQAFSRKEFRKRSIATIPFTLTPNFTFKIRVFLLAKHMQKPAPVRLQGKTNKKLKSITKFVCAKTGKELWDHELGTFFEFGKEKIRISKDDLTRIKSFSKPGLELMGFKNTRKLKDYMNIKPGYFLHTDEKLVQGSGQILHSLILTMLKKNKIAVCRFLPRAQSIVRFVGLLPSLQPQGLFVVFLPFADDIRSFESVVEVSSEPPSEKLVEAASLMTLQLRINEFHPEKFPNPGLQHFYATMEAWALEQTGKREVQDALVPDEEGFQKKGKWIQEFFFQVMEERPGKRQAQSPPHTQTKSTKVETPKRGRGRGKK